MRAALARPRLFEARARSETCVNDDALLVAVLVVREDARPQGLDHGKRHPQIRLGRQRDTAESVVGDAHDRQIEPIQPERAPENVRRLLETGAPQPVTDDDDRYGRRVFVGREATTECGRHTEHLEVARRDELDLEPLRHFADTTAEGKLHPGREPEAIRAGFDEIEIVRSRDVAKLAFGGARHDDAKTLGLRNGERAEQERVNDAEDGDVGADAEAETRDGYRSEAGPACDPSKRPPSVPTSLRQSAP